MKNSNSILKSISNLVYRVFTGKFKFDDGKLGKLIEPEDGKQYKIFRDLRKKDFSDINENQAVFVVTFKFANFPLSVNKVLSMMPAPFLVAKTGFHEKIWATTSDGHFMGLYQWETADDANDYPGSFIFKLMTKRAAKDSMTYKIMKNKRIEEFLEDLKVHVDKIELI